MSMEKFLFAAMRKVCSDIDVAMNNLEKSSGTRRITEYMNIEHGIGKFHGYLEVLEEINLDKFARAHTMFSPRIERALKALEGLYHEG